MKFVTTVKPGFQARDDADDVLGAAFDVEAGAVAREGDAVLPEQLQGALDGRFEPEREVFALLLLELVAPLRHVADDARADVPVGAGDDGASAGIHPPLHRDPGAKTRAHEVVDGRPFRHVHPLGPVCAAGPA